jgi:hypothetical protein
MKKHTILAVILILLAAMLVVAAIPATDVKPMVNFTAKEQMCKVTKEGTVKVKEDWTKEWGMVQVCQDSSSDPLATGEVTLETIMGYYNTKKNNSGWIVYRYSLKTDQGTWKGYRLATTDSNGVTYTSGKAWGAGSLGYRPNNNGWQMWYKMTDEYPAIINGKYTADFPPEE